MERRQSFYKYGVDQLLQAFPRTHHYNFGWTKLEGIFSLYQCKLNPNFLRAAVHRWDSSTHCFDFGGFKLCPTIEEFEAIMGKKLPNLKQNFVTPLLSYDFPKPMCDLFGITKKEVLSICPDHPRVSLAAILDLKDLYTDPTSRRSQILLCFCVLAVYFLTSYSDNYYRLVNVIEQLQRGLDPFPLILAETICALDRASLEDIPLLGGSPLLLQIWLYERLSIVAPPPSKPRYTLAHFRNRALKPARVGRGEATTIAGWSLWLERITMDDIRCVCPWWGIEWFAYREDSVQFVSILSFTYLTFYVPDIGSFICRTLRVEAPPKGVHCALSVASRDFFEKCWATQYKRMMVPHEDLFLESDDDRDFDMGSE